MPQDIYSKAGADAATSAAINALGLGTAAVADAADFEAAGATAAAFDVVAVDQITLTAPLALTIPAGFPAGQVYRATLTQDGTGGHTVTYGGQRGAVDLTAGAVTTVELHPTGAGYVVRYPGVVDLASLSSTYVPGASPQKFGATGDGITDDTTALQAWLDSVPDGGGILHLPVGKYLVPSGGLTCDAPVQIMGAGTGTYETASGGARILTASTTANLLTLSSPGAVISGVTFENTATIGTETAGAALLCTDFDWGRIERCMFIGFWNQLQVDSGYFYSVRDSAFLRPVNYGAYMRDTAVGQHDHGDQVIEGCNFSKYGSNIDGATAMRWESGGGLRVVGSKCNAGTQPGYVSTRFWSKCIDVQMAAGSTSVFVVSGSSFEGYLTDGIRVAGDAGASFGKIAISGNEFLASGGGGAVINLDGTGMTALNSAAISGNVAYGSGSGIGIKNMTRVTVSGNEFGGLALSALVLTNVDKVKFFANNFEKGIVDNDANDSSSAVGQGRDPWQYRRDIVDLTGTNVQFGRWWLGNYAQAVVKIRVRGNAQTVGGFYIEQTRHLYRATGAVTVGTTIGTDLALGPGAAEVTVDWDVSASPYVKPKLTSVNGKTCFGVIDVTIDGPTYSLEASSTS